MEIDGPARRTRSVTGVKKDQVQVIQRKGSHDSALYSENLSIVTPPQQVSSPKRKSANKGKCKTPSGNTFNVNVDDIRNFFQSTSVSPGLSVNSLRSRKLSVQTGQVEQSVSDSERDSQCRLPDFTSGKGDKGHNRVDSWHEVHYHSKKNRSKKSNTNVRIYCDSMKTTEQRAGDNRIGIKMLLDRSKESAKIGKQNSNQIAEVLDRQEVQTAIKQGDGDMRQRGDKDERAPGPFEGNDEEDGDEYKSGEEDDAGQKPQNKPSIKRSEPEAMDLKVVVQMFKEIKQDMKTLKDNKCKQRMDTLEADRVASDRKLSQVEDDLRVYKMRSEILTGVVKHMSQEIQELKGQVEKIRETNMKNMISITGFDGDKDNKVCKQQLEYFLAEELGVQANILDLFQTGQQAPRMIVITVDSIEEILEIFRGAKNLKGMFNEYRKKYIFRDYLPPGKNEQKCRQNDIVYQNNNLAANKIDMEFRKGELMIKKKKYVKKVKAPDVTTILNMSEEEINSLLEIDMDESDEIKEQDSIFVAYTLPVENFQQIEQAYMKMKLLYADARHITCVYLLPGVDEYYCKDYYDDDEHSLGRVILRLLQQNQIVNRAVYIVRYCTQKIGPNHFTRAKEAVMQAINRSSTNPFTKQTQRVQSIVTLSNQHTTTHHDPVSKPTNDNALRGHGRGYSRGSYARVRARGGARGAVCRIYKPYTTQQMKRKVAEQYSIDSDKDGSFSFQPPIQLRQFNTDMEEGPAPAPIQQNLSGPNWVLEQPAPEESWSDGEENWVNVLKRRLCTNSKR